jgi:hypothetical protein
VIVSLKNIREFVHPLLKERKIIILFSIGDVRVFSGINWLVDDDRALKKPERRR